MENQEMSFVAGIPTLNIKAFTNGTAQERSQFVSDLGTAYENIGFVAIHGHDIADAVIRDLYTQSEDFFGLPAEAKRAYARPETKNQRGFVSMGIEHAKDSEAADLKEFWQVGQPHPPADADMAHFPPNHTVEEVPEFKMTSERAFEGLERLGQQILRAIALHLELEETYFEKWVSGGNSILRAIHYPPIKKEPESAVRAGQHEDINLITLLVGASASGLEVLRHDDEWIPVTALPEHIVVNVGDMLQRLTNYKLKSTTHRVVNPPREEWDQPRFSMPFFCHPRPEMRLDALPHLVPEGTEPKEGPISAGDYLDQRLKEIGLASK